MALLTLPNDTLIKGPLDTSLLEHLNEYYNIEYKIKFQDNSRFEDIVGIIKETW